MKELRPGILLLPVIAMVLGHPFPAPPSRAQVPALFMPEQCEIPKRDPASLCRLPMGAIPRPGTVASQVAPTPRPISLDEAIRIALQRARVVRVLSSVGTASGGQTIYAPAIQATTIDQARARFDPTVSAQNNFLRSENPSASFDPLDPTRAIIDGSRNDAYDLDFELSKQMISGGTSSLRVGTTRSRLQPGLFPLNPQATSAVDLSVTQPLLQGQGADVNEAPIVLARIDTEQSYFRLKDSLQEMVRGVIQGYWDVVQARTDLWILEQQIKQAQGASTLR